MKNGEPLSYILAVFFLGGCSMILVCVMSWIAVRGETPPSGLAGVAGACIGGLAGLVANERLMSRRNGYWHHREERDKTNGN